MIEVDEYRFSKRKTLSVCIDVAGRVIVRAPKGYPQKRIDAFLLSKQAWIEKHRRERMENACLPPEQIDGYLLPYLGGGLRLKVCEVSRVKAEDGVLYLPQKNAEEKLIAWLKRQALALFQSRTIYWQGVMQLTCKGVKVSGAKRKWGSCSSNDEIRYVYRLIYAPLEAIDYVVVHELSHIRYKNHSSAFWQEVSKYLPDYALRRAWLKKHASLLEIF